MPETLLPPIVALCQFISERVESVVPLLKEKSFLTTLIDTLPESSTEPSFNHEQSMADHLPDTITPEQITRYFQLLALTIVCGDCLYSQPSVKQVFIHENDLRVEWKSLLRTPFTFGKDDRHYTYFLKQWKTTYLTTDSISLLSHDGLARCYHLLSKFSTQLSETGHFISDALTHQKTLPTYVQTCSKEALFLIMSSLPNDALNHFYLLCQKDLSDETTVNLSASKGLNLSRFWATKGDHLQVNFEKLKLHFNLVFFSDTPYFNQALDQSLRDHLAQSLHKTEYQDSVSQELRHLKDTFIPTLHTLFSLFSTHLRAFSTT
tara:strand:+ start:164 stop:1123 length:960 start_codon:yes stop_codon:yes gene_type:complete